MDSAEHQVQRVRKLIERYTSWADFIDKFDLKFPGIEVDICRKQTAFMLRLMVHDLEIELA